MNTTRETKEFTTTGGHKIVYKTYITGREFNEMQQVYFSAAKMNMVGKNMDIDASFDASVQNKATEKQIEMIVVSVDDIAEGVVDKVLDLPLDEYNEVLEKIESVANKKKE